MGVYYLIQSLFDFSSEKILSNTYLMNIIVYFLKPALFF